MLILLGIAVIPVARFHQLSTMHGIMQQAQVFLSEGTVQKTVSASVGAIPPAKPQQGFGILFLVPKSDVHKKGMSILIPFLSSIVVHNEINENG